MEMTDGAEVNRDELKQQILIVYDAELNRDILARFCTMILRLWK